MEEIEGLGMKNHCKEKGLEGGPHRDQLLTVDKYPF
jgi:hypothetical protein